MVHPRGHYGEHLTYDIADYEINLRLLNTPNNLVVAASGPQVIDGDWLRYRLPNARNFVFSFSPDYQVLETEVGGVTVYSYAFPVYGVSSAAVLQTTIDSLILYQELFGAYPHATLSVVQADFLDGMEYDGLYYLSRAFYNIYSGTPGDYLIAIAAHETAHQWWYALIGNNQAIEPWLDEALCTYMEHIYYERYAPEALDWWWRYRVNYYEPRGLIDVSIYDKHSEFQSYRDYRDAVYLNGAIFLHELRTAIGDSSFFAFLKDYAARYAGGIATRQSFFTVLAEHSSQDLSPLISKYFNR
jgi:aminopeptidase N